MADAPRSSSEEFQPIFTGRFPPDRRHARAYFRPELAKPLRERRPTAVENAGESFAASEQSASNSQLRDSPQSLCPSFSISQIRRAPSAGDFAIHRTRGFSGSFNSDLSQPVDSHESSVPESSNSAFDSVIELWERSGR